MTKTTTVEQIKEFPNTMRDDLHQEVRKLQNAGYWTRIVRITSKGNGDPGGWGIAFKPREPK